MNQLKVFENEQFGQVRIQMINDEPWFVAADVCAALDVSDAGKAVGRIDDDELTRIKIVSGGQTREMLAVNEPGLYSLVLGSRKKEAKDFKRWVTHEVLPSIRKHGIYATEMTLERMINDPATAIVMLQTIQEEREKRKEVEAQKQLLVAENRVLAKEAMTWDINAFINSMVKAYSKAVTGRGPRYAVAWNLFKAALNNKCRINIEQRATWYHKRTGKKTPPKKIDLLNDDEKLQAAALIVAMCRDAEIDITDYMKHVPVELPAVV